MLSSIRTTEFWLVAALAILIGDLLVLTVEKLQPGSNKGFFSLLLGVGCWVVARVMPSGSLYLVFSIVSGIAFGILILLITWRIVF